MNTTPLTTQKDQNKRNIHPLSNEEYDGIIALLSGTMKIIGKDSNLTSLQRRIKRKAEKMILVTEETCGNK